jgi:hypothetical protein
MNRGILLLTLLLTIAASLWPAASGAHGLDINITIGAPPALVVIPGTPVYYAPTVPANYFFYGGQYYLFANNAWFVATAYNGPWLAVPIKQVPAPILAIPVQYYKIPPGHWKKHGPPPWAGHGHGPKPKHHKHD